MGYKKMTVEILQAIFRRWHHSQNISVISKAENLDRKTIRKYINHFKAAQFSPGCNLAQDDRLTEYFLSLLPASRKSAPVSDTLLDHKDEIIGLLTHSKEPVKAKSAWKIITHKYDLSCSYESFKRFTRMHNIKSACRKTTIRLELPPGQEIQVDYGKVGMICDPVTGKNRVVHAFCGILSHSRLPYIEFCYKQDQTAFVKSHVKMFQFFGGTPEFVTLDNLKSGVIKPDLYDPKLNRAYQEMAVHYDLFINPCKVRSPKEKGKIERMVPNARELYRTLKHIHPTYTLAELNKKAKKWCISDYGQTEHGTTGIAPHEAFLNTEKQALKNLPVEAFSVPFWKKAKVHPDQFFVLEGNRYSLPAKYRGQEVWLKKDDPMLSVYHEYRLVRSYIITGQKITCEKTDFPQQLREMMNGGYPKYLLEQALLLGLDAHNLVESILKNHAYINSRRAQAVLEILKKNRHMGRFDEICRIALAKGIQVPKRLKVLFNDEKDQLYFDFEAETSAEGKKMIREADYYIH